MDEPGEIFERHRRRLVGIAYRMLGSVAEAHDVVQDTYVRWHQTDRDAIRDEAAWLTTVCSRLALNRLNSARHQRESYVGTWLPEPFPMAEGAATTRLELDETVSCALLVVLERLSPNERATYLLHDVFDYPFDQIANMLGLSTENCRKLATRARQHIHDARPRFAASAHDLQRLLETFLQAAREGDLNALLAVLSPNAVLTADGGGKAVTIVQPLSGAEKIARFFIGVWNDHGHGGSLQFQCSWFNGAPGILVLEKGTVIAALSADVEDSHIARIYAVRNPDKLAHLQAANS
jgi:RNA polymerase sigma-70 factor (ECF subfamily)